MKISRVLTTVLLAAGFAVAAVSPATAAAPGPGIIGGTTAGSYPWAAVLLYPDGFQNCSGSLVAPQWVITAGHCLADITSGSRIRVGSADYTTGGTLVAISAKYKKDDIALLKLASPVSYTPIQIASVSPASGSAIRMLGWGVVSENGDSPRLLKQLDSTVQADSLCARDDINGPHEVCVKSSTHATACYGDSGGPAIVNGLLVGADSRGGNNCGDTGGEIYGDLTTYRTWITQHTGV